ncbi:hypothetical protein TRFO_32150 [Tritrichomonas foetus]|uniref:Maspardin n=1 Tax=Tritrichomonas foetus TaxID=1144522 RepID=A0A1J4JQF9_9EUKA|nr:hypothetical protein TRFO_32150 [Tritrichomonas foetus]|eukprot:OHT00986.1 hypothetical protein TRFO_32150 [Tritrichomonas foetus]
MTEEGQVELNLSSSEFINYSCNAPTQQFTDTINEVIWEFRQGGPVENDEAVVIISDIYDSINSMYLVATRIMAAGYRVVTISIPGYQSVSSFMTGFDLFTASKLISKVHLVGFGFGAFLALNLASFPSLSAEIISLSLVSGFMSTTPFKKVAGFFSAFTGKSDLHGEVFPSSGKFPSNLKPAASFELKELESIPAGLVAARVRMRATAAPVKLPKHVTPERILIIQPCDWTFKMDDKDRPQKAIQGTKYVKIETGGHLSHLANPNEVTNIIKQHIEQLVSTQVQEEELDNEEEEEDF